MKTRKLLIALSLVGAASLPAHASNIGTILSEWSVITSGNLTGVTDVQGNAYVGGNISVGNSIDFGNNDSDTMPAGNVGLAVAGSVNSGNSAININAGNVVVGGTDTGGFNNNSGGTIKTSSPGSLPSSPVSAVTAASSYWSGLTANSSASIANNVITFNCNASQSVAVFNVSASQLFQQNQSLALVTASGTKDVIINVSGTSATMLNSENVNSGFQSAANKVIFNFYQANNVSLQGSSLDGYVIAPNATVGADSPIVGGVMAETLDTGSEVDLGGTPSYASLPDVTSVPDGGTTATLLGISFSGLAIIRRKYFGR